MTLQHQTLVINGLLTHGQAVESRLIFINMRMWYTVSKFENNKKCEGRKSLDIPNRPSSQRPCNKLEYWDNRNLRKFNKQKCKDLHVRGNKATYQRRHWGSTWLKEVVMKRTRETQWTLGWTWTKSVVLSQIKQIFPCYASLGEVWGSEFKKLLLLSTQPWWGCSWNTVSGFSSSWSKIMWRNEKARKIVCSLEDVNTENKRDGLPQSRVKEAKAWPNSLPQLPEGQLQR